MLTQILFGGTLEDKLAGAKLPVGKILLNPHSALSSKIELPEFPGRVGKLIPSTGAGSVFPKKGELKVESARGRLLHFFANHEMLAIETMAYTLLKFPDAPLEFRQGVMHTIQDEQRHLGMYVDRMREYGVNLGDFPLNFYFWKTLKTMESPMDFVIRMSLTFEQANLDFALEYARLFEQEIDDPKTAKLLRDVHDDEIKHVAHGVKWFQEWSDPGESEWDGYVKRLPFPITPRRGKGAHYFSAESRKAAGLSEEYISEMKIAGGSRGRVPDYFFFNPQCEIELKMNELSQGLKTRIADLAPLMLWLAQEDDVVELPSKPPLQWLKEIYEWKGELPEIILSEPPSEKYVAFEELKPWGWGRSAWKKRIQIGKKLRVEAPATQATFEQKLFSKAWWKEQLATPGVVIRSEAELRKWKESNSGEFLFKSEMSTSGRGHLRLPAELLNESATLEKLQKRLKTDGLLIVEPFLKKRIDFSTQIEILRDGKVHFLEPRFFQVDSQFQYLGACLGSFATHADYHEYWNFLQKNKNEMEESLAKIVSVLKSENYYGPVGVDSMIYETESGELQLAPVIEVNVRYTMGRVAHEIERRLKKKGITQAQWRFFNQSDLIPYGVSSFGELAEKLKLNRVIATTPPELAVHTWSAVLLTI